MFTCTKQQLTINIFTAFLVSSFLREGPHDDTGERDTHEQEMSKSKLCKVFKFTLIYEFFDHGHGFKKALWVKDFDT